MLAHILISQMFAVAFVFCRVGSALILLPGFGEAYVPMRIKVLLAIMVSLLLAPAIKALPVMPNTVFGLFNLMLAEILIGLFLGGLSRILISAIHMTGTIIAYQSGMTSLIVQDLAQIQSQSSAMGNLMSIISLLTIFATNLHHVMLQGLADSYSLFLPGIFPMVEDFAKHATTSISGAFTMAMQLSAPFIVLGIITNLGAGMMSRLMPAIQIFFIMTAPQLMLSFFFLMITLSTMMTVYMEYYRNSLNSFLAP